MKYYLLDFGANYADEFDVNAFKLLTEDEYNKGLKQTEETLDEFFKDEWNSKLQEKEYEIGFGTNEYLTFCSKEDYFGSLNVKEITKDEYNTIERLLGKSYGVCTYFFPQQR